MRQALVPLVLCTALAWGQVPVRVQLESLPLAEGSTLRYTLLMPPMPKGKRVPLVLSLHYGGQVTPHFGRGMAEQLVQPALAPLGALIAAPDCPGKGWSDPTSVAAVRALLTHLKATHPVDPGRIAVVGFSMGAMGIWHWATHTETPFKAAVALAGLPREAPTTMAFPIHAVFSRKDELFPEARFRPFLEALESRKLPVTSECLDACTHHDTACWVPALRRSLPWLRQQLDRQVVGARSEGPSEAQPHEPSGSSWNEWPDSF